MPKNIRKPAIAPKRTAPEVEDIDDDEDIELDEEEDTDDDDTDDDDTDESESDESTTAATGGRGRRRQWTDNPVKNFELLVQGYKRKNPSAGKRSKKTGLVAPAMITVPGLVDRLNAICTALTNAAADKATFSYKGPVADALLDHMVGQIEAIRDTVVDRPAQIQSAKGFRLDSLSVD